MNSTTVPPPSVASMVKDSSNINSATKNMAASVASPTTPIPSSSTGGSPLHNDNTTMKVILASPATIRSEHPASEEIRNFVADSRHRITEILSGKSSELLAVVGPCSIHDPAAALDYGKRLLEIAKKVSGDVFVVMRVYCEKPRTGAGWKGLIRDPFLDGSNDIGTGLVKARQLLLQLNMMGLPCACEFLDPIVPEYIQDLVSWGAIGARTSESQIHRELASGLSMPVGFKNSTSGSLSAAIDGVVVSSRPHSYIAVNNEGHVAVQWSMGNKDCHLVLRGGHDHPNYGSNELQVALDSIVRRYAMHGRTGTHASFRTPAPGADEEAQDTAGADAAGEVRHHGHGHHRGRHHDVRHATRHHNQSGDHLHISVVVDCSHGNSFKDYRKQKDVVASIAEQMCTETHARRVAGVMLESFLVEGAQQLKNKTDLEYGKSITDGCINLAETSKLLEQLAEAVQSRRKFKREESPAAGRR